MGAWRTIRVASATLVAAAALPAFAQAATTYTVNTDADNAAGASECLGVPTDCGIRQAIDKAATGVTVATPIGHYTLDSAKRVLKVTKEMSIVGTGNPIVDGGGATPVFEIGTVNSTLAI